MEENEELAEESDITNIEDAKNKQTPIRNIKGG
jgi:hypothetical protein